MIGVTREAIMAALFNKLIVTTGVKTYGRKLVTWNEVPAAKQPALFMIQLHQEATYKLGLPIKWTLPVEVYVYVHKNGNQSVESSTLLNNILDAVEQAIAPASGEKTQTLGGLVSQCSIQGRIETDEGVLGDQAVAIITIEIITV